MSRFENARILVLVASILLGFAAEGQARMWDCSLWHDQAGAVQSLADFNDPMQSVKGTL